MEKKVKERILVKLATISVCREKGEKIKGKKERKKGLLCRNRSH